MAKRKGTYTVVFDEPISVRASAAVGSKKESEGPIGHAFDVINEDDYFGEKTGEKAVCSRPRSKRRLTKQSTSLPTLTACSRAI